MKDDSSIETSSITISTEVNLVTASEFVQDTQDIFNLIARRAFELFEARGCTHGNDLGDWILAQSELFLPLKSHLSESGEHLTARVEVPGLHRQEIKVSLEPRRLSISGQTEPRGEKGSEKHPHSHRHAQLMFHVLDLPCEVDPSKAKATFNNERLEVVMPKVVCAKSASA